MAMIFDPLQFLEVAESLRGGNEAQLRTAIGRAYYAVFLKARDNLAERGLMIKSNSGEDHGRVIATLKARRRVTAGSQLDALRELRGRPDYQTELTLSLADRERATTLAQEIKRLLGPDWGIIP